jgi:anaerobic magnesium-protoporphyrin IX monomethyl ester cyclase
MINVLLLGERLAYRSFNGANKALPVLASSLVNAGFRNVVQMDFEQPDVEMADVCRAAATADLIIVAGAMTPQWGELDQTLTRLHRHLRAIGHAPPVIVGGYAAKSAEDVLRVQPAITALFDGEGEEAIVQIAEAVAAGNFRDSRGSIRGLCYLDDNGMYRHSTAPRVRDISSVEQNYGLVHNPARHNMEIFAQPGQPLKTAQLYTQRGCPWVCGFCNKSTESSQVARLSEESFRAQLSKLRKQGYTSVYLDVDTFTVNIEAARREAAILHEEGFIWGSNTRIDRIDLALMREFVQCGCVYMFCGVEHIDEGVCIAVQKFNGSLQRQWEQARAYREKIRRVYREMALAGLPSSFFVILGLPKAVLSSTGTRVAAFRPTTFEEDVECVRYGILECDPDYFNFNLLRFMPGTVAADLPGQSAYTCVRPSGTAPITAGYFLPRLRSTNRYRLQDNHGVFRLCESIGPNQPTTTAVDPERVHRTFGAAIEFINRKCRRGGKLTRLFLDEEIRNSGLVSTDRDGCYRLASLRDFESLASFSMTPVPVS